jgi:hypothetical protein
MRIEKQLSVFLVNKPGRLANICSALAHEKINIMALTLVDSTEHGVLRVVVNDAERAKAILSKQGVEVTDTDVVLVEIPNRPGAFAALAERLAREHININYAYCTAGAPGGKTTAIFKVAEVKKAVEILKAETEKRQEHSVAGVRPAPGR